MDKNKSSVNGEKQTATYLLTNGLKKVKHGQPYLNHVQFFVISINQAVCTAFILYTALNIINSMLGFQM